LKKFEADVAPRIMSELLRGIQGREDGWVRTSIKLEGGCIVAVQNLTDFTKHLDGGSGG